MDGRVLGFGRVKPQGFSATRARGCRARICGSGGGVAVAKVHFLHVRSLRLVPRRLRPSSTAITSSFSFIPSMPPRHRHRYRRPTLRRHRVTALQSLCGTATPHTGLAHPQLCIANDASVVLFRAITACAIAGGPLSPDTYDRAHAVPSRLKGLPPPVIRVTFYRHRQAHVANRVVPGYHAVWPSVMRTRDLRQPQTFCRQRVCSAQSGECVHDKFSCWRNPEKFHDHIFF